MAGKDDANQKPVMMVVYGGGIVIMLGFYGVIQERIMSVPYGPPGAQEMFKISVFLVLFNRLIAIMYATSMISCKGENFRPKAPLWKYIAISFSNVAATTCQYEALKYVSFPVQMLGKSFKMMPVMLWSILISGKKYGLRDWLIAAGVTAGVTIFLLTGETKAKHADKGSSIYGLMLLGGFLAFDGFTSTFQEKLFKQHQTSKYNQMLYVNAGSAFVSAGTLLLSGQILTALPFCFRHLDFVMHASCLSFTAVSGQFFIYSLVKEFGALILAVTMNIRQVVSILNSYYMYGHSITILQVMGLCLVFVALFSKSLMGRSKKAPPAQVKPEIIGKQIDEDEEIPTQPTKQSGAE